MHFGYRACLQFLPCPQADEMAKIELFPPPSASKPEFGLFEQRKIKSIQRMMQKKSAEFSCRVPVYEA